jgi:hypothetical protein
MTEVEVWLVRWMKSLDHCWTSVAIRAQQRLSPRLRNHRMLHAKEEVAGTKGADATASREDASSRGSSWREICVKSTMDVALWSGVRFL